MLLRCGLMIIRSKEIVLEILSKLNRAAFYSDSQTRRCTTGAVPQHQGAVLGNTTQLFLDIWGLVRDSSLVVSENEYCKTHVKTIHRCRISFMVEDTPDVSS